MRVCSRRPPHSVCIGIVAFCVHRNWDSIFGAGGIYFWMHRYWPSIGIVLVGVLSLQICLFL